MSLRDTFTRFFDFCISRFMVDIFTKTAASAVLKPKFVNQFLRMQEASVGSFDFRKIKFENQDVREKKRNV